MSSNRRGFFEWSMKEVEGIPCQTRRLGEMVDVLYDRGFAASASLFTPIYHVYRNIPLNPVAGESSLQELRYDATVIPPLMLGQEFPKTFGHYHTAGPTGLPHAEIYEVLTGTAHLLLQKRDKDAVVDVALVEANQGEKMLVPLGYGHLLINPTEKTMVTGNLVSTECVQDNEFFRRMRGGAYYELKERRFVKNRNYGEVPELRIEGSCRMFGHEGLRDLLLKDPDAFRFLVDPAKHSDTF